MMTRNDLFGLILAAVDDEARVFDHTEIITWPPGSPDEFRRLGLIRQVANGLYAPCPNCADGHIEPVAIRAGPSGAKRFYIWCPRSMRVDVQPEMCNGWEVGPARPYRAPWFLDCATRLPRAGRFLPKAAILREPALVGLAPSYGLSDGLA